MTFTQPGGPGQAGQRGEAPRNVHKTLANDVE